MEERGKVKKPKKQKGGEELPLTVGEKTLEEGGKNTSERGGSGKNLYGETCGK